ncbi:MAG TPA: DUF3592 domain-containing protein [Geobacteraceae bacterium]|nr:DUF3592 domain-containing protein [Geobacteraceae bacterium]
MEIGNIDTLRKFFQPLILLISILMIGKGSFDLYQIYQTYKWPSTAGIVTTSCLGKSTTGKALYWPVLKYKYFVFGKEFESNRYSTKTDSYSTIRPFEILEQYKIGTCICVYYNPAIHSEAVIDRLPFESPIPFIGGIFLFFFGLNILPRIIK